MTETMYALARLRSLVEDYERWRDGRAYLYSHDERMRRITDVLVTLEQSHGAAQTCLVLAYERPTVNGGTSQR